MLKSINNFEKCIVIPEIVANWLFWCLMKKACNQWKKKWSTMQMPFLEVLLQRLQFLIKSNMAKGQKKKIYPYFLTNRAFRSVVFKSGQKMALRAFYFIRTLTKALTYYYRNRSQRHLLAAFKYIHILQDFWMHLEHTILDNFESIGIAWKVRAKAKKVILNQFLNINYALKIPIKIALL